MEEIKLTKVEKALLLLAEHMERCPNNQYKVVKEIMAELGYERAPKDT